MGYYAIKKSSNDKFYFVLHAVNGEVIATSQMYADKQGARKGIESVRKNGPSEDIRDETHAPA